MQSVTDKKNDSANYELRLIFHMCNIFVVKMHVSLEVITALKEHTQRIHFRRRMLSVKLRKFIKKLLCK